MNSLRHVFWRGAMALSLLTLGVGSGFGFREVPVQASGKEPSCESPALRAFGPHGLQRTDLDAARAVALQLRAQGIARRG